VASVGPEPSPAARFRRNSAYWRFPARKRSRRMARWVPLNHAVVSPVRVAKRCARVASVWPEVTGTHPMGGRDTRLTSATWRCGVDCMPHSLRVVFLLVAAVGLGVAGSASSRPTKFQLQRCEGLVKGAPWTESIRGSVGPVRGSRYAVWIGSFGPSCALAKQQAARLSRLRTSSALRRASFGGFKCRVSPLSSVSARLLSVQPRAALGGCWTTVGVPTGRYFYWQPRR
jgi:hypothetical protein